MSASIDPTPPLARSGAPGPVAAIGAAWLLSLGFDLFLHAGALARLYARPSDFVLPASEAFRRIPLGYAAFLVMTAALYWLYRKLQLKGALAGFRFGLVAGLVVWGAWLAGLYSVSTADADLLVGWWVGQSFELALAGAVFGAAADGMRTGRLYLKVSVAVVLLVAGVIVLQLTGAAPPMATVGSG